MRQKQGPKRRKADSAEILIFRYFFFINGLNQFSGLGLKGKLADLVTELLFGGLQVDFNKIILQHNRSIKLVMQRIIRKKNGAGICHQTTNNLGLDTGTTFQ